MTDVNETVSVLLKIKNNQENSSVLLMQVVPLYECPNIQLHDKHDVVKGTRVVKLKQG